MTKPNVPQYYFDIRVRDRLVAGGTLDPEVLKQHIAELPDLEAQADTIGVDQPALNPRDGE